MSNNHWNEYHRRWSQIGPPLRPDADVVATFRQAIGGHDARVLLLGVTPELADIGHETVGIDRSEAMIAHIWPGDTPHRRAQLGQWLSLPCADGSFTAAIGDGSLSAVTYPGEQRTLLSEMARAVAPGGVVALRLFATPEVAETITQVREAALARCIRSFHAFKWQVAMALTGERDDANVAVAEILRAVDAMFRDREMLSRTTGWSRDDIATIDVYRGSKEVYGFPTVTQLRAILPPAIERLSVVPAGTYPLAERCPIAVMKVRA